MKIFITTLLSLTAYVGVDGVHAAEIQWRVENRFPVFSEAKDFQKLEAAFGTGTATEFLAKNHSATDLRELLPIQRTAWQPESGTYDARTFFNKEHAVRFTLAGETGPDDCTWQVDTQSHVGPCGGTTVIIPEKKPFSVQVSRHGVRLATLNEPHGIQSKLIVGIGDSFASGEGNPDHPTQLKNPERLDYKWFKRDVSSVVGDSAAWWDKSCHRSLLSWQALYAMRQAIVDPHRVVRFASFACSGAEVYDGFFHPQAAPPGMADDGHLALSQQRAVVSLLCQNGQVTNEVTVGTPRVDGPRKKQSLFGQYSLAVCSSTPLTADEILLSFGGNDFGFSGVVKWGIGVPDVHNHRGGILGPIRTPGLRLVNKFIRPIDPQNAAAALKHMPQLYKDIENALTPLRHDSARTVALIYPDPLPVSDYKGCQLRTRDGNHPLALLINNPFSDFKFGLGGPQARQIRSAFIDPLRARQIDTISALGKGWVGLDANHGLLLSESSPRTICGNTATCANGRCEPSNRLTWTSKTKNFSNTPRLDSLLDFKPYDPARVRGLRSASDALLTQSARTDKNKQDDDWVFGIAHPTAAVHATIADHLFDQQP